MKYKGYLIKEKREYWIMVTDETEINNGYIYFKCKSVEEAKEFIDKISGEGGLKYAVK